MQITMKYEKKGLPIDFPDGLKVDAIRKKAMPIPKYPEKGLWINFIRPVSWVSSAFRSR